MKTILQRVIVLLLVVNFNQSYADTIDFWHIYINQVKQLECSDKSCNLEVSTRNLKESDSMQINFYSCGKMLSGSVKIQVLNNENEMLKEFDFSSKNELESMGFNLHELYLLGGGLPCLLKVHIQKTDAIKTYPLTALLEINFF
jgi:hypothetical protein